MFMQLKTLVGNSGILSIIHSITSFFVIYFLPLIHILKRFPQPTIYRVVFSVEHQLLEFQAIRFLHIINASADNHRRFIKVLGNIPYIRNVITAMYESLRKNRSVCSCKWRNGDVVTFAYGCAESAVEAAWNAFIPASCLP
jgi:hypothetical protein